MRRNHRAAARFSLPWQFAPPRLGNSTRLDEDSARRLLLVRAIESEDVAESLLTREDRHYATGAALAHAPVADQDDKRGSPKGDQAFLARRSEFALSRLEPRYPAIGRACRSARWPRWIDWALPLAALVIGILSNEIDGRQLNIVAFPLIGMIAWNLVTYLVLLTGFLRRLVPGGRHPARPNPLARLIEQAAVRVRGEPGTQPLGRALRRFAGDWLHFSSALNYSRASRTLHASAALLAAGVLLGMYWRALGIEYRAGWESTYFDAATLHGLVSIVLGPASALTGIALPSPAELQALRWSSGSGGANAGPWIHLYATSAFLFIIGPRLVLAAWHALRAARLRGRFPIPGVEDFYVRRLLRSAGGGGSMVRVIPYSFHPPQRSQRQLQRLLTDVLGEKTRVTIDPPIPYGGEDEWLAGADLEAGGADHLVVLFNLSATPEAENHGALVAGIQRRLVQGRGGAGLTILLDETAYRQRLAGQSGADSRLETRRRAWETMLVHQHVTPLAIDLDDENAAALARPLECALMQPPPWAHAGSRG